MLGGGLWGTVLAQQLALKGRRVQLWEFFPELAAGLERTRRHPHIPGFRLAPSIRVTSDLGQAILDCDPLVFVLPSNHVRRTAARLNTLLSHRPRLINASKGVEPGTLKTMGEVIEEELPALRGRVYTISGPSFAREVARGVATGLVLAGPKNGSAEELRKLFDGGALRVELSADRKGVELGGSLKNVLAIGAGMLDGLKAGANTKAALIVQGLEEMGRLMKAHGGRADTAYGLSGIGDLIATGTSPESRNRGLGEKLGSGKKLKQAMKEIPTVMEGVEAAQSAYELAKRHRCRAPLIEAIWKVVHRGASPGIVPKALGF